MLFLAVFLITRLPFYIYYPFTIVKGDSASYFTVAFDLLNSNSPVFDLRTPGYPLFLYSILIFTKSLIYFSVVQSLLTLFMSIFFLITIYKTYKQYLLLFATALSIFISSSYFLMYEVTILSEGIYVNFLIISSCFLILALKKNKLLYWILLSSSMAVTIIIRPAGLFLVCIVILLLIFLVIKKYKFKFYVSLIAPLLIAMLSLCTYNFFVLNAFSILPVANIAGATILFMEPSNEYPEHVNKAINAVLNTIPRKEKSYVRDSYEIKKLYIIFWNNFNRWMALADNIRNGDHAFKYMDIQPIIRKISIDAIRKHPDVYAKFIFVSFWQSFRNLSIRINFYDQLKTEYESTIYGKKYIKELEEKKWRPTSTFKALKEEVKSFYLHAIKDEQDAEYTIKAGEDKIELVPTALKSIYELYEKVYNLIFRNVMWEILFFLTFIVSSYRLVESKLSDIDSVLFFLLGTMVITNILLVSSVDIAAVRFTYTTEFVMFLSLPFLIILLRKYRQPSSS